MKAKRISLALIAVFLLMSIVAMSCTKKREKCPSSSPYYCEDYKVCCKYKYNDGHGTCWETMSGCRSTGYACVVCHIED